MEIKNRVVLIVGGVSGLGRATADLLFQAGAKLALFDQDEALGQKAQADFGDGSLFIKGDVTQEADVLAALAQIKERFGALHVSLNCAAIGPPAPIFGRCGPFPLATVRQIVDVNLVGTLNVSRLAAQAMADQAPDNEDGERGVIINVSSIAGLEGHEGDSVYGATKGGVIAATLPMARDLAPYGIRVVTIAPGVFGTAKMHAVVTEKEKESQVQKMAFPKRFGKPPEFARVVREVIENVYFNGSVIRIDAGIRL